MGKNRSCRRIRTERITTKRQNGPRFAQKCTFPRRPRSRIVPTLQGFRKRNSCELAKWRAARFRGRETFGEHAKAGCFTVFPGSNVKLWDINDWLQTEDTMKSNQSKTRYDVVIVGSGHNGLVAAAYLAKAGLSVLILERNDYIGGATASPRHSSRL